MPEHLLPIDYATLQQWQQDSLELLTLLQADPQHYMLQHFPTENPQFDLICYRRNSFSSWRICILDSLLPHTVNWYHLVMNHIGSNCLCNTISMFMSHPHLSDYCEQAVQRCKVCQHTKTQYRQYSKLPPCKVKGTPWSDIAVDLFGPWKATIHGQAMTFQALTIIDMVTNYCELICINNKSARHVAIQLENARLSRYPRPVHCLFDQGGEFIGHEFTRLLHNHGIKPVPLMVKNPQSNALCKRLHLAVGNVLRTLVHYHAPNDIPDVLLLMDTALQTAAYSACTVIHGALKYSPGSLAFHRDMLFDILLIADMELIHQ
jgi:transposase InsO family protein